MCMYCTDEQKTVKIRIVYSSWGIKALRLSLSLYTVFTPYLFKNSSPPMENVGDWVSEIHGGMLPRQDARDKKQQQPDCSFPRKKCGSAKDFIASKLIKKCPHFLPPALYGVLEIPGQQSLHIPAHTLVKTGNLEYLIIYVTE